jgi:hypothetical protein
MRKGGLSAQYRNRHAAGNRTAQWEGLRRIIVAV